jgi:hypothetical protein
MRGLPAYLGFAVAGVVVSVLVAGSLLPHTVDVSVSAIFEAPRAEIWRIASEFEARSRPPIHRTAAPSS